VFGFCGVPSPRSSTVRHPMALGWAVAGAVTGFRRSQRAATAKAPRDILPISIGEATGRPKKTEATCIIDHKWPYNESLSTPPFDRLRVVSVVEPQSWGCLVLGRTIEGGFAIGEGVNWGPCQYCSGFAVTGSSSTVWKIGRHLTFTLPRRAVMRSFGSIPRPWHRTGVFEVTN